MGGTGGGFRLLTTGQISLLLEAYENRFDLLLSFLAMLAFLIIFQPSDLTAFSTVLIALFGGFGPLLRRKNARSYESNSLIIGTLDTGPVSRSSGFLKRRLSLVRWGVMGGDELVMW